ncbi:fumarylacetoacetate hydrolase family protein [Trinickia acidisoli]|uniref:fumarylacetoacetate hydrolase family protein n=1 Tax=Trinickia acidisoli TaxID=2767482 RepID=UPI001A8C5AF7|nr:fumarylacetoacetate hydrolase family protein [Trinickia acidisoli]
MKTARVVYNGALHTATSADAAAQSIRLDTGRIVGEAEVTWLPPVAPRTTFALGLNYADHAKELAFKAPEEPLVFLKGSNTFVGHRSSTVRPSDAAYMHYECELAVVIGRRARNVDRASAYDYVRGYTIANDYAVRDYLENYYRPSLRVKNRDTCTPLGPWLVERADVPDPMNLALRTYVNGRKTQDGSTRDMIFDIASLIAYLSGFMTLDAGDLILTGTPQGLADTRCGDEVVCEIAGIGRLVNTIVSEANYYGDSGERGPGELQARRTRSER